MKVLNTAGKCPCIEYYMVGGVDSPDTPPSFIT